MLNGGKSEKFFEYESDKIEIFIKYVEQIQNINKYFSKLENKGWMII